MNYSPDERTAISKVRQVGFIPVHVPQVVLASDQDDRGLWTESSDLLEPHRATIPQRLRICDGEAQQDNICPSICESTVLFMVAEGVPKTQGNIHTVHHLPGTFEHLK